MSPTEGFAGRNRVLMALAFYPRGGSAQVARYLATALSGLGTEVTLCSGSLGEMGAETNATTFFAPLPVESLDFTPALEAFALGQDPMRTPVPIHPSFEDRSGAPDRVFASLDDMEYRHQVSVWRDLLDREEPPSVYHLHHLTHINDAVAMSPSAPVVVHLHGTELKMLEIIRDGSQDWAYSGPWRDRLVVAAHRADRLISLSPADRVLASELLGVPLDQVEVVPNGVDLSKFTVDRPAWPDRLAKWATWLVDEPRGWDESGVVGSVAYTPDDLARGFTHPVTAEPLPVLLFVGRFLAFKRVPLLIRAYAQARAELGVDAPPLVVWGGHPGEWEGEHPHSVAGSLGVEGVFFAGWRGHDDLPDALNCCDVLVAPSVDEPFGQVYLEAMATGLAVIGTRSGGPPSFVNTDPDRPDGWLVEPDSVRDLAAALVAAVRDIDATRARGANGRRVIERDFDWQRIAARVKGIYEEVEAEADRRG